MEYIEAKFLTTAVKPEQYPDTFMPEIAFVGRSNVGKSSLINCLTNRAKLARTSSSPGKTATINFYEIKNSSGTDSPDVPELPDKPGEPEKGKGKGCGGSVVSASLLSVAALAAAAAVIWRERRK